MTVKKHEKRGTSFNAVGVGKSVLSMYGIKLNLCYYCNELGGNMARFTQFPIMITRSTIIY